MLYLTLAGLSSVALAQNAVLPTNQAFSIPIPSKDMVVGTEKPPETLTLQCSVGGVATELVFDKTQTIGGMNLYETGTLLWIGSATPTACKSTTSTASLNTYLQTNNPTASPSTTKGIAAVSSASSLGTGARSSAVPSIVTDTLSILAEIAYEQAKSRAYDTVADGVRTQVCDRLVLVKPLPIGWASPKGTWEITLPEGELLPATCDELESHSDFISLVNSADTLAAALVGDIVDYGGVVTGSLIEATKNGRSIIRSDWARGEIRATLDTISQVLRDNAVDGTPPDINDARQMLALFAERSWGESPPATDAEKAAQVALKSVFVLSDGCVHTKEVDGVPTTKVCSAREVVKQLRAVEEAQPPGPIMDLFHEWRPEVEALALDVIRIAATSDRGDTTAVVKASFSTAFDLVDLVFKVEERVGSYEWSDLGPLAQLLSEAQTSVEKDLIRDVTKRDHAMTALIEQSGKLIDELTTKREAALTLAGDAERTRNTLSVDFGNAATALDGATKAFDKAQRDFDKAEKAEKDAEKVKNEAKPATEATKAQAALDKAKDSLKTAGDTLKAARTGLDNRTKAYETASKNLADAANAAQKAEDDLADARDRVEWVSRVASELARLKARFDSETFPEGKDRVVHEMLALVGGRDEDPHTFILDILHQFRGVVLDLAQNDVASALSDGCQLLLTLLDSDDGHDKNDQENSARWLLTHALRRVVPVVGVLASNAHSLAQAEANPDDTEALRTARKDALEGLIKANTNRSGRDGDWVVSLGANVGFNVLGVEGGADLDSDSNAWDDVAWSVFGYDEVHKEFSASAVPIMLPMGLAFQRLPNPQVRQFRDPKTGSLAGPLKVGKEEIGSYFDQPSERTFAFNGYHIQLSIVDLAQFLGPTTTLTDGAADTTIKKELQWSDFLMVGLQGGFAFGRAQDQLVVGADLRIAPYSDNAFRASIFASYYVPFFDFN